MISTSIHNKKGKEESEIELEVHLKCDSGL